MMRRFARVVAVVIGLVSGAVASAAPNASGSLPMKGWERALLHAPAPDYPYDARRLHITGSGVCVLKVRRSTGEVVVAEMAMSTGSDILDKAALRTFARWRFKPGLLPFVQVSDRPDPKQEFCYLRSPVTFVL